MDVNITQKATKFPTRKKEKVILSTTFGTPVASEENYQKKFIFSYFQELFCFFYCLFYSAFSRHKQNILNNRVKNEREKNI